MVKWGLRRPEERWCFGVEAGEQGPDDRFVPSVLEESCAQLGGRARPTPHHLWVSYYPSSYAKPYR